MEEIIEKDKKSDEIKEKIEELYSFDVFDTLITRKTAIPTGIFALMQKELETNEKYETIPLYLRNNFYNIRINSEIYLRNSSIYDTNSLSVTINEINAKIWSIYQFLLSHNEICYIITL